MTKLSKPLSFTAQQALYRNRQALAADLLEAIVMIMQLTLDNVALRLALEQARKDTAEAAERAMRLNRALAKKHGAKR